jgi:hypothetical protein
MPISTATPVVVIGDLDAARRACDTLTHRGHAVVHLLAPTEDELRTALTP